MTCFERMKGIHITYPVMERQKEFSEEGLTKGYEWFGENHRYYDYGRRQQMPRLDLLPKSDRMAQNRTQHKIMRKLPKADKICKMPYKLS